VSRCLTLRWVCAHSFTAITIANKTFSTHSLIHETIRIKSGAWDDAGVFIYSTLNHVKYCLSQGYVHAIADLFIS
jgi:hypothetical protein